MDQLTDRFPIRAFSLYSFILSCMTTTTEQYNEFHTLMHKLNKDIFRVYRVCDKKNLTPCAFETPEQAHNKV